MCDSYAFIHLLLLTITLLNELKSSESIYLCTEKFEKILFKA